MVHFISGKRIWWDTETTGLGLWKGDAPFAWSFCNEEGETAYFEWDVDPFTRRVIPVPEELEQIRALLEDPEIEKEGHNVKFDVRAAGNHGIKVRGRIGETMHKAHNCNSREINYKLKHLGDKYGGIDQSDQTALHKCVVRLRRKAAKLGWKIAFDEIPQMYGPPKRKAAVAADYWIPRMMYRLHPELVLPEEASLCEEYAIKDAYRTMLLGLFYEGLIEEYEVREVYEMEQRLWHVVWKMEQRGVRVDPVAIKAEMQKEMIRGAEMFKELEERAWPGFNPASHWDVRRLAIEVLGLNPVVPEGKKLASVGAEFLEKNLSDPTIHLIAKYRASAKAFGAFFSKFNRSMVPDPLCPGGYAIHGNFRQTAARTARLSCSDPNLQTVTEPDKTKALVPVYSRHVFQPRPGYAWLCADYSNMEVRVFAEVAQEPVMLEAIHRGENIHTLVANRIWGGVGNPLAINAAIRALCLHGLTTPIPEVLEVWKRYGVINPRKLTPEDRHRIAEQWLEEFYWDTVKAEYSLGGAEYSRTIGKMVTFLKIYGGGLRSARKLLKDENRQPLPDEELLDILAGYDTGFVRLAEFSQEIIDIARKDGYIKTLWGRRLSIDPEKAYKAVNYLVQGSSADLLKSRMIATDDFLTDAGLDAYLLLSIHDELVFEISRKILTKPLLQDLCLIMEDTDGHMSINMPVEPKIVWHDWGHKDGRFAKTLMKVAA